MKTNKWMFRGLAAGVLLTVASIATAAASTTSSTTSPYQACSTSTHVLSLEVNGKCSTGAHVVMISGRGATGTSGATGATGAAGLNGTPGVGLMGAQGIQGIQGAQGVAGVAGSSGSAAAVYYHQTIATPGADQADPATVTLATIGPFTVTGSCYLSGSTAYVSTVVSTTQDHSALSDYDADAYHPDWMSADTYNVGTSLSGSQGNPSFEGPNDGTTAFASADGSTFVNLSPGVGSYVGSGGGATVPACSFFGFYSSNVSSTPLA